MLNPKQILLLIILALIVDSSQAQTASLEKAEIFQGDVVKLVIEFENQTPSLYHLDTSPLDKNFDVLNVDSSLKTKFDATNRVNLMHWSITLQPKTSGRLEIPSLQIKQASTPVRYLEVKPLSDAELQSFRFEIDTEPPIPMVNTEAIVTVRLKHNIKLENRRLGRLTARDHDQLSQFKLGEENYSVEMINQQSFDVIEQRYAIVPTQSGSLDFEPVELYADIIDQQNIDSIRHIKRNSEPLSVSITPRPETIADSLVARRLTLDSQWHDLKNDLSAGDSLSMTLSLYAEGLPAELLPQDLLLANSQAYASSYSIYADNPIRKTETSNNGLSSILKQDYVIVFETAGEVVIPDTILKWWDTQNNRWQQASLTGKKFIVSAPLKSRSQAPWLRSTLTWLLVALVLVIVYSFRRWIKDAINRSENTVQFNRRLLKIACLKNDAPAASKQIRLWRQQVAGNVGSALNRQLSLRRYSEINLQITKLEQFLYSENPAGWQGRELWQVFSKISAKPQIRSNRDANLPDLYPG